MEVTLKLYGILKQYIYNYEQKNKMNLKLDSFQSIKQILEENNIPTKEVSFLLVGSETVNFNYQVKNGDVIKAFPRIIGG
ncbi:hypothetical protein CVT91_05280 [Candidatus Atribacteria bacterium HGW-Atribacteria-1]|nr:MAG: hypothetical protein CVT91_05280 [Candidatus Atribacteria bacterium HGW-Atribacteria-1]